MYMTLKEYAKVSSAAQRVFVAEALLEAGIINNPKDYFKILNTGSLMCSCGGSINVHKRTCPEYKTEEQQGEDFPIGMIDFSDNDFDSHKPLKKCECGAESIGSSGHSSWCPKG